MILTIISHTPHFLINGSIHGWEPTIREINHLSVIFTKIYHIAPFYDYGVHNAMGRYNSNNIEFVPIKPSGGKGIFNKIDILFKIPYNLKKIIRTCKNTDWIQFRGPTNLGLYVLPYISYFSSKYRWVKYAGDWNQYKPPLSYLFQRHWLNNNFQKSIVTINGTFVNQKRHLLSFENPCLTEKELIEANLNFKSKSYLKKLNLCFIGRMDNEKGSTKLVNALKNMNDNSWIGDVFFIGDGPQKKWCQEKANSIDNLNTVFTGFIPRSQLNQVYKKCHILILPSTASEGFPKVIAEGAAHGLVPIVSDVGGIGKYIDMSNGVIINEASAKQILSKLIWLEKNRPILKRMANNSSQLSKIFTYEQYNKKIRNIIDSSA
ncbi:MAG: capsular biosynthesis protein [Candidatus Marinimicrobia bacterium]|nr:capsular biosynthesis protein [Candidatus Neomarinimicrobiota bacterium]